MTHQPGWPQGVRTRAVDASAWSALMAAAAIYIPAVGGNLLGDLGYLHALFASCTAVSCWLWGVGRRLSACVYRYWVRALLCALLAAGTSPFVSWWTRMPHHPYFLAMTVVAACAAVGFLVSAVAMAAAVASQAGATSVIRSVARVRVRLLYGLVAPMGAFVTAAVVGPWLQQGVDVSDVARLLLVVPAPLRYLTLLPVVDVCVLLLRIGGVSAPRDLASMRENRSLDGGTGA